MKLVKNKIIGWFSGMVTVSGLAMLFLGLLKQMNTVSNFAANQQLAEISFSVIMLILTGIIMTIAGAASYLLEAVKIERH